jgi:hypothetical protein
MGLTIKEIENARAQDKKYKLADGWAMSDRQTVPAQSSGFGGIGLTV